MYTNPKRQKTTLTVNNATPGERMEQKVERIRNNNEPVTDGAQPIYTERSEGVRPELDIRTDWFDDTLDKIEGITDRKLKNRANKLEAVKGGKQDENKNDGKTESTQGTTGESGDSTK